MNSKTGAGKSADRRLGRNYDRAAWFYETSAKIYSTNQIRASKRFQARYLNPGDHVLYLGAGAGEDAAMAARLGARVTCIDLSQAMLDRIRNRLEGEDCQLELICGNALELDHWDRYDVVAANYFLNVFRKPEMIQMLKHTARLVKPGGRYLIADVARRQGCLPARMFNEFYLKLAMASFWTLGLVPWHENYDYQAVLPEAGLQHEHTEYFRFARKGPVLFQSIVARRPLPQSR